MHAPHVSPTEARSFYKVRDREMKEGGRQTDRQNEKERASEKEKQREKERARERERERERECTLPDDRAVVAEANRHLDSNDRRPCRVQEAGSRTWGLRVQGVV